MRLDTCNYGLWKCPTRLKCIRLDQHCDGYNDCGDLSDEGPDCRKFILHNL